MIVVVLLARRDDDTTRDYLTDNEMGVFFNCLVTCIYFSRRKLNDSETLIEKPSFVGDASQELTRRRHFDTLPYASKKQKKKYGKKRKHLKISHTITEVSL